MSVAPPSNPEETSISSGLKARNAGTTRWPNAARHSSRPGPHACRDAGAAAPEFAPVLIPEPSFTPEMTPGIEAAPELVPEFERACLSFAAVLRRQMGAIGTLTTLSSMKSEPPEFG
eukprot:6196129-Pleurochrysis_carterae.AAC.3